MTKPVTLSQIEVTKDSDSTVCIGLPSESVSIDFTTEVRDGVLWAILDEEQWKSFVAKPELSLSLTEKAGLKLYCTQIAEDCYA